MSITIRLPYHVSAYTISCDCGAENDCIYDVFRNYYGIYCSDGTGGDVVIRVRKLNDRYMIHFNGNETINANPLANIHNIIYAERKIVPNIFALHAGAVSRHGKTAIFAASTASGKTTLISYLLAQGYEYISDDCVFVDMTDLSVYPYHNPVHLREGGVQVLKEYNCLPVSLKYADERYIFMPKNLSPMKTEIGGIYFLERTVINEVVSLKREEAFSHVLKSPITAYRITPEYIRFINRLTPLCKIVRFRDMEYVAGILEDYKK